MTRQIFGFLLVAAGVAGMAGIAYGQTVVDCETEYLTHCQKEAQTQNLYSSTQCLKRHVKDLSPGCQQEAQSQITQYEALRNTCRGKYLQTCRWDIDKGPVKDDEKSQKILECLLAHWDEYNGECQEFVRRSIPFFSVIEQNLDTELLKRRQAKPRTIKIAGTNKKVRVEAQDGDVIWYEAKLEKKKVIDQYEFCPEMPAQLGFELQINTNQPSCFYKVHAPWGQALIDELKITNVLTQITDYGIRESYPKIENPIILAIVRKYLPMCPDKFEINIYNYTYKKPDVFCQKIERFFCKEGEVMSYPDDGYFGCQKFAECAESGEGYVDFGDKKSCAVCYAGGCVDQSKTYPDLRAKLVTWCKVNFKNPGDMSICEQKGH